MDNDKKIIIDGDSVIEASNPEKSNDLCNIGENAEQQRQIKKKKRRTIVSLVIIAILICILIAAIVIISLWTSGVQFQEKNHRTIGNKEIDEELYQDAVDSLTSYHVHDSTKEFWVILDYNRELEIMKVQNGESTTCYVSVNDLSKTHEKNQTATDRMQTTTPGAEAQTNETLPVVILRPSRRPILEKSMLGKRGQQLCQDVDTFWILSSCNPSVGNDPLPKSRVRRATYTYYSCYWDITRCHDVIFEDSPGARYYCCDYTCGYQTIVY